MIVILCCKTHATPFLHSLQIQTSVPYKVPRRSGAALSSHTRPQVNSANKGKTHLCFAMILSKTKGHKHAIFHLLYYTIVYAGTGGFRDGVIQAVHHTAINKFSVHSRTSIARIMGKRSCGELEQPKNATALLVLSWEILDPGCQ